MAAMARHSLTLDPMGILTFSLTTLRKLDQKLYSPWVATFKNCVKFFTERHQLWPPRPNLV